MYNSLKQNSAILATTTVVALLMLAVGTANALPDDRAQPIRISADQALRDEKSGFTSYQGNVVMSQGSLHIKAHTVTVYHDAKNVGKIVAEGGPAMLEQQPDAQKKPIKAQANIIEYYKDQDRVQLKRNARIQQDGSTVTGDTIDYYMSERRVTADSDTDRPDSRVVVVIPGQTTTESVEKTSPEDLLENQTGGANGTPDR